MEGGRDREREKGGNMGSHTRQMSQTAGTRAATPVGFSALPPPGTVIIEITFLSELDVRRGPHLLAASRGRFLRTPRARVDRGQRYSDRSLKGGGAACARSWRTAVPQAQPTNPHLILRRPGSSGALRRTAPCGTTRIGDAAARPSSVCGLEDIGRSQKETIGATGPL